MAEAVVLLNAAAGGVRDDSSRVIDALHRAGINAEVRQITPSELTATARKLIEVGTRLVVAAGGDGTVNAVASAVLGSQAVLGVLPVGTLNHFARDLGLPSDLDLAVQVLRSGQVRVVDAGEVNGRIFVNNCSIGLYPSLVIRRERQRQRLGRGRWLAMLLAILSLFKRYPLVRVALESGGGTHRCASPLVFVGNNPYETDLLNIGRRHSLSGGQLSVYFADAPTRLRLLRLVFRAVFGKLRKVRDFQSINVTALIIESRKRRLRMAMDGEVIRLHPPLMFRIRPGELRVMSPA
jgi:diacylglycerol kinase family enzyme